MILSWNRRYSFKSYLDSALWIVPIIAAVIEFGLTRVVVFVEERWEWEGSGLGMEGARSLFNTVTTLSLSYIVFTFGSLLVAIQVASGQYTPRIIATALLRDNVIRWTVGLFVMTLLYSIRALNHLETGVPQFVATVGAVLGLACLAAFLFLIDYAAKMLRPVSLAKKIGESGLASIAEVYPEKIGASAVSLDTEKNPVPVEHVILNEGISPRVVQILVAEPVERVVQHVGTSATVLAVNVKGLVAEAERTGGVIQVAPQVGDFVAVDEPLFFLHGAASRISDDRLRSWIAFGPERTVEQDPLFAFRVFVDIAIKALSAAINDPTTAVLALDQLHRLLRRAGTRNLRTEQIFGREGGLRVILRTPGWKDFVNMACSEIRFCGVASIQIPRRMRAMLLNLQETLPVERHAALNAELAVLDEMIEKFYVLPTDRALARIPDPQGMGGSTGSVSRIS